MVALHAVLMVAVVTVLAGVRLVLWLALRKHAGR